MDISRNAIILQAAGWKMSSAQYYSKNMMLNYITAAFNSTLKQCTAFSPGLAPSLCIHEEMRGQEEDVGRDQRLTRRQLPLILPASLRERAGTHGSRRTRFHSSERDRGDGTKRRIYINKTSCFSLI